MAIETLVNVTRDGTQINQNIAIQIDFAEDLEMRVSGGIAPFYRYEGYIWQTIDLRQNDYLQDQLNTDPVTGTARTYQVIDRPEVFPDGHLEMKLDDQRVVGFN